MPEQIPQHQEETSKPIDKLRKLFPNELIPDELMLLQHLTWLEWIGAKPDNVIALGHNWERTGDKWPPTKERPPELSIPSKLTSLAAVTMYLLGMTDKVIFSGGQTAKSAYSDPEAASASPTEAAAMRDYVLKLCKADVSTDEGLGYQLMLSNLHLEDSSTDTYTNASEVNKLLQESDRLDEKGAGRAALSSIGYHLTMRANEIFNSDLDAAIVANVPSAQFLQEVINVIDGQADQAKDLLPTSLISEIKTQLLAFETFMQQIPLVGRAHGPEYHFMAWGLENALKFVAKATGKGESQAREWMSQIASKNRTAT